MNCVPKTKTVHVAMCEQVVWLLQWLKSCVIGIILNMVQVPIRTRLLAILNKLWILNRLLMIG